MCLRMNLICDLDLVWKIIKDVFVVGKLVAALQFSLQHGCAGSSSNTLDANVILQRGSRIIDRFHGTNF